MVDPRMGWRPIRPVHPRPAGEFIHPRRRVTLVEHSSAPRIESPGPGSCQTHDHRFRLGPL
jgi:hypothetical protein